MQMFKKLNNILLFVFSGPIRFQIGKDTALAFPKLAPWFTIGFPLFGIFQPAGYDVPELWKPGAIISTIAILGFIYQAIFSKPKPKTPKL
jgi:hypothetical protein